MEWFLRSIRFDLLYKLGYSSTNLVWILTSIYLFGSNGHAERKVKTKDIAPKTNIFRNKFVMLSIFLRVCICKVMEAFQPAIQVMLWEKNHFTILLTWYFNQVFSTYLRTHKPKLLAIYILYVTNHALNF